MILAIDVYYKENSAKAVGVLFDRKDEVIKDLKVAHVYDIEDYIPGEFYKRELPCVLKVIEQTNLKDIELIIIDGYVYVDNNKQFGLGGWLWKTLETKVPVIGVAKTSFLKNKEVVNELYRGESKNPLYISSIGCDINKATELIKEMKGNYRIPDILKLLDKKTKKN
ncbi:MAG TPA: endonuclease V [Mucilaginibacter sp.]|jgi:deoxyribonuclease V|nr:endonuclease V [Mucilaginibacter sp.]